MKTKLVNRDQNNNSRIPAPNKFLLITLVFCLGFSPSYGQINNDILDKSFDNDGWTNTAINANTEFVNAIIIQDDGKIVAAGSYHNGFSFDFAVARYNSNGSLDTGFDTDGIDTFAVGSGHDYINAMALQTDGKIVVAGNANNGSNFDFALARFNSDGSLDTGFDSDGVVTVAVDTSDDYCQAVAIQSDGKIVAVGFTAYGGGTTTKVAVVRFNSNGSLDTGFDTDGKVITDLGFGLNYGQAVKIQSDGKIVVGGYYMSASSYDFMVVRYNSDGSLDTGFDSDGIATKHFTGSSSEGGYDLLIQNDGKIVLFGHATYSGEKDFALARFNSDGSLDTGFGSSGVVVTDVNSNDDVGNSVLLQPDGKIVATGYSNNGANNQFSLVRYLSDGSLDPGFATGGKYNSWFSNSNNRANSSALQSDGKIVLGGRINTGSGNDFGLARYSGATQLLPSAQDHWVGGQASGMPLNTYMHDIRHQSLYLASDLTAVGIPAWSTITKIEIIPSDIPGQTLNNFRVASTSTSNSQITSFESTSVVYGPTVHNPADFSVSNWFELDIDDISWNGSDNLVIEFSHDNSSYTDNGGVYLRQAGVNRAVRGESDSQAGSYPFAFGATAEDKVAALRLTYEAPAVLPPSDLTLTARHERIDLSWTASTDGDVAGYVIYQGDASDNLSPLDSVASGVTSYASTGLTNGNTYYYGVKAKNSSGEYSPFTSIEDTIPAYDGPEGWTAANGDTRVALNWDAMSAGTLSGYFLYRGTTDDPTTVIDSIVTGSPRNSYYIDENLTNDTTYYYRIRARFTDDVYSGYSESIEVTPEDYDITVDGNVTDWAEIRPIVNDATGDVGSADLDSIKIYTDGYYLYGALVTNTSLDNDNVFMYLDVDFNAGTGESINGIGADYSVNLSPWSGDNFSYYSGNWNTDGDADFTAIHTNSNRFHEFSVHLDELDSPDLIRFNFTTNTGDMAPESGYLAYQVDPNDSPRNLTAANSDTRVALNWDAKDPTGLAKYFIYRGTAADPTTAIDSIVTGNPLNSYYLDEGLTNATTYYYRLRAEYSDGSFSDYTDNVSVVPNRYAMTVDGNVTDWPNINPIYYDDTGEVGWADIDSIKINADGFYLYGAIVTDDLTDKEVSVYFDTDFNAATGESFNDLGADFMLSIAPYNFGDNHQFKFRNQFSNWESDGSADFQVNSTNNNSFHEFYIHLDNLDGPDSLRFNLKSDNNDVAPASGYLVYNLDPNDAVRNFTAANGDTKVNLNWDAKDPSGLDAYFIYRGAAADPTTVVDSNVTGTPLNSYYLDTELVNGTTYHYRIRARYSDDTFSDYTESIAVVPDQYTLTVDGNIGAWANIRALYYDDSGEVPQGDIDSVKLYADDYYLYGTVVTATALDWDEVVLKIDVDMNASTGQSTNGIGADYLLRISPYNTNEFKFYNNGNWDNVNGGFADFNVVSANNNSFHEFKIGLEELDSPDQIKFFYSSNGGEQVPEENYLAIHTTKVAPDAPTGLTGLADSAQVTLRWNANAPAKLHKYRIYRSSSAPVDIANSANLIDSLVAASPPDTVFVNTGLTNDLIYYYVVIAVDSTDRASDKSNEIMAIPNRNHEQLVELLYSNTSYSPTNDWGYPFNTFQHEDVLHQSLYLAEDFIEVGIPSNAWISAIELKPVTVTGEMNNFRIAASATALTEINNYQSLQNNVVHGPLYYDQSDFTDNQWARFGITSYQWNGSSNWLLEVSHDNDNTSGSNGGAHIRQVDGNHRAFRAGSWDTYPFVDNWAQWNTEDRVLALRLAYSTVEPIDNLIVTEGHRTANLTWSAPGSGTVQNYLIYSGTSTDSLERIGSTTSTSYTVSNLTNGQDYYIGVQVVTSTTSYSSIVFDRVTPIYDKSTWYVDIDNVSGINEGSPEAPYTTIKSAFVNNGLFDDGDTVLVLPGTYSNFEDRDIDPPENLTFVLQGTEGADSTIINLNNLTNSFIEIGYNVDQSTIIEGFTFQNGNGNTSVIELIAGANLLIRNCVFSNNTNFNGYGGAINLNQSSPLFENCTFENNQVSSAGAWGGAVYIWGSNSQTTFNDCSFSGNQSIDGDGGALHADGINQLTLNRCNFNNNSANFNGGALYAYNYTELTIDGCTFTNNNAGSVGGAISTTYDQFQSRFPVIKNSLFSGNSASGQDNAKVIYVGGQNERLLLQNVTMVDNGPGNNNGPAIYVEKGGYFVNSIIWNNSVPSWSSLSIDWNQNPPTVVNSILENGEELPYDFSTCLNVDPLFTDPANGDYTLSTASHAIGAGTNSFTYTGGSVTIDSTDRDLADSSRVQPGLSAVDMGAYENLLAETPYPGWPTGLVAEEGHREVILGWDDPLNTPDVDYYIVYQSPDSASWDSVSTVLSMMTRAAVYDTITGLTNKLEYYFAVAAVDTSGYEGLMSEGVSAMPHYQGPVWYVDPINGVIDGEGSMEEMAQTIRPMIMASSDGDTILLKPGTYSGFDNRNLDLQENWNQGNVRNLVLVGEEGADSTIIDIFNNGHFLNLTSGEWLDSKLIGLTIKRGSDAAIRLNNNSKLTLKDCILSDNNGGSGGAVNILNFALAKIINVLFEGNSADSRGGAVYINAGGSANIKNSIFYNNHANHEGGAIAIDQDQSKLQIIHSLILDNSADTGPGGIMSYSFNAYVGIHNSIFWDNIQTPFNSYDLNDASVVEHCILQEGSAVFNLGTNWTFDPMIADAENGDFALSEYSPAIGSGLTEYDDFWQGVDTPVPATDYFGNDRPNPVGSLPDLGPIEHERSEQRRWVYLVNDVTGNDLIGDGGIEGLPFKTIQRAIDETDFLDTVQVAGGTYIGDNNKDLDFGGMDIVLRSSAGPDATIINCGGEGRGFEFSSGEPASTKVIGFTVLNGSADEGGAIAIYPDTLGNPTSPSFWNMKLVDCGAADEGGALYADNSNSMFANTIIANNSANSAGAAYLEGGAVNFLNCTIVGNMANDNTAIVYDSGDHGILNSILWDNTVNGDEIWFDDDTRQSIDVRFTNVMGGHAGEGNLNLRPGFVDPSARNFHLEDWSPMIGVADTSTFAGIDYDYNARTVSDTTWPDLGAFESNLNTPDLAGYLSMDWYVSASTGNDDNGNGTLGDPFQSIQYTTHYALYSDTVRVMAGTYGENVKVDDKVLHLVSLAGSDQTVIDGNSNGRVLSVVNGGSDSFYLDGFTIHNGTDIFGGGIRLRNTSATIRNSVLTDNSATAGSGGGLWAFTDDSLNTYALELYNTDIVNNSAITIGGGFRSGDMEVTVQDCEISGNTAEGYAGFIVRGELASLSMYDCIITGNEAVYGAGGGISHSANGTISTTLIYGNIADIDGSGGNSGGLSVWNGADVDIENCTIADNTADHGSGLTVGGGAIATVSNSIFLGNQPDQLGLAVWESNGGDLSVEYSLVAGGEDSVFIALDDDVSSLNWDTGNIDADPDFVATDDYHLLASSPAINSGDPGQSDADGTRLDMGVYPYLNTYTGPVFYVTGDGDDQAGTGDVDDEFASVQAAVNFALANDTVWIDEGTYLGTVSLRDYDIVLSGTGNETIIDGDGLGPVLRIGDGFTSATIVRDLVITGAPSGRVAIRIDASSPSLQNLWLQGNDGGVYIDGGNPTIEYSLITDNTGDGIIVDAVTTGNLAVVNNTIAANGGVGIINNSSATVDVRNTILFDNTGGSNTGTITATFSDVFGAGLSTDGNIDADPMFVGDSANNDTYALALLSPCVDTGDSTDTFDPDSTVRDMGALPLFRTFVGGNTDGDDIIVTGDTTVVVNADLTIDGTDSLIIEPGSTLYLGDGVTLTIVGVLDAFGLPGVPISFRTLYPGDLFYGIILQGGSTREVPTYSYLSISDVASGEVPLTVTESAVLEHVTIAGNDRTQPSLSVTTGSVELMYSILESGTVGTVNQTSSVVDDTTHFVDLSGDNYNLDPTSTEIDIGVDEAGTNIDPDYTYSDAGALYFDQSTELTATASVLYPAFGDTVDVSPDTSSTTGLAATVQMFNQYGRFKTNAAIDWSLSTLGDFAIDATDTTDLEGRWTNTFVTSTTAGELNQFTVSSDAANAASGVFRVVPGVPDSLFALVHESVLIQLDTLTLVVEVFDQFDNAVSDGETVNWTVVPVTAGFVLESSATTTASGVATVDLMTDPDTTLAVGDVIRIQAESNGATVLSETITVVPDSIFNLSIDSTLTTDPILLSADTAAITITATMIDTFDNPLEGVDISWLITAESSPGGLLNDNTTAITVTDAAGRATVDLTTGTDAAYEYWVEAWINEASLVAALNDQVNADAIRIAGDIRTISKKSNVTNRQIALPIHIGRPVFPEDWDREAIFDLEDTTNVIRIIPGVTDAVVFEIATDTVMTQQDTVEFVVEIFDHYGNPVADSSLVTWELDIIVGGVGDGLTFSQPTSITEGGLATVVLSTINTLDLNVGQQYKVIATCEGIENRSGQIYIVVDYPYNLAIDDAYDRAPVADANSVSLAVTIIDRFDYTVDSVSVYWSIIQGAGGILDFDSTLTDEEGLTTNTLITDTLSNSEYKIRIWVDNEGGYTAAASFGAIPTVEARNTKEIRSQSKQRKDLAAIAPLPMFTHSRADFSLDDTTDAIIVQPGAPALITSEKPDTVYVVQGQSDTLEIVVYDQFDNLVSDGSNVIWNDTPTDEYTIDDQETVTSEGKAELALTANSNAPWLAQIDFGVQVESIFDGNFANHDYTYIVKDTIPPAMVDSLTIDPAVWTSINSFDLSWSNQEEHSRVAGVYYDIEQNTKPYVPGLDITALPDVNVDVQGVSTIRLWLQDEAGNEDIANAASVVAKWDSAAPDAFTLVYPTNGTWMNIDDPVFDWNASSDATSDLRHYRVDLDGTEYFPFVDTLAAPVLLSERSYTLTVFAVDSAYNETEMTGGPISFDVDFTNPNISHQIPEGSVNQAITITATITDDESGIAAKGFYYRKGGQGDDDWSYVDLTLQPQIPSTSVTSVGVEYYLEAIDVAGNITTNPVTGFHSLEVNIPLGLTSSDKDGWTLGIPNGTSVASYQLIAFPGIITNKSPTNILVDDLGAYDNTQWRFFEYGTDGLWNEFANISSIERGKGYFLIVKDAGLHINTGITRSVVTDELFAINVPAGEWVVLGNPFDFAIPLANVFDQDTFSVAGNANFQTYDGGFTEATSMDPWQGYIYKAASGGTLYINPRDANGGTAKILDNAITIMEDDEWLIDITARNGFARDLRNRVGVLHRAQDTYDRLDSFEPPVLPGGVSLRIDNRHWSENSDIYATDIKSVNPEGSFWDMEVVASDVNNNVNLTFAGLEDLPEDYDIFLIDKSIGTAKNLSVSHDYYYAIGSANSIRKLRLVAGTRDFVKANSAGVALYPESYSISQNFPNPFNPKTTILISIEDDAIVDLVVYNLLGEVVTTLARDEYLPTGYYNYIWSGRNDHGQRVASGIYFYASRIKSPSGKLLLKSNKKMILIK